MIRGRSVAAVGLWLCGCAGLLGTDAPGGVKLLEEQTPWRTYLVTGPKLERKGGALTLVEQRKQSPFDPAAKNAESLGFSRLPQTDWAKPDADVSFWARYVIDDLRFFLSEYGSPPAWGSSSMPALLCLRTAFGISEPTRATDLKISVTFLGGAVVYVNGKEIGREFLPKDSISPLTPAADYTIEAYTASDGTTPLPDHKYLGAKPDQNLLARLEKRARSFTVAVPKEALVKGGNILAVEIHQAPVTGPLGRQGWAHLGVGTISLTSASGAGVISYAEAMKGVRLWSANPEDQVTNELSDKIARGTGHKVIHWVRGLSVQGIQCGNPFDPVLPIRMAAPRNGVAAGQVVVSDPAGLNGVSAKLSPLKGPGKEISATAAEISYAGQTQGIHYCDALLPAPTANAKTVPVWVVVQAPKDQAPGWYVGTLNVKANGKDFTTPVQLLVTGATLPEAKDFTSLIGAASSYETIALHYGVKPWSDEHFRKLETGLRLLGQIGNDVLQVPVITQNQFSWKLPLIRFQKDGDGLKPDFTVLEKYLDLYLKHCTPPKAFCLYVWDANCAKRGANSYEGRQIPSREFQPKTKLLVQAVDGTEVPAPHYADPGAEKFYKRLAEGVAAIIEKRGCSKRALLFSMGGDNRPSQEDGELHKKWLPGVRWNLLSHFSGDAGSFGRDKEANELLKTGKFIVLGGHEVGLKEHPWRDYCRPFNANSIEKDLESNREYLDLGCARWHWADYSPPLVFRTLPLHQSGNLGRLGLDFWGKGPINRSYFTASSSLTAPGADGPAPTVRFQMLREGVQDVELRLMIVRAYLKLGEDKRKPYRNLLDEYRRRTDWAGSYLSQHELGFDWRGYAAQVQQAAAELTGEKSEAKWEQPPK